MFCSFSAMSIYNYIITFFALKQNLINSQNTSNGLLWRIIKYKIERSKDEIEAVSRTNKVDFTFCDSIVVKLLLSNTLKLNVDFILLSRKIWRSAYVELIIVFCCKNYNQKFRFPLLFRFHYFLSICSIFNFWFYTLISFINCMQ